MSEQKCLNCEQPVVSEYCSGCGQSTKVGKVTFADTIGDFFSSTFALEGPLLLTIASMITKPGVLLIEFLNGKRKTYYKPVSFFVVLTAVYLILRSAINFDPLEGQMTAIDENAPPQVIRMKTAAQFMVANINNIMFFLVLSIGLTQKLFFWKKYNLAEYVVAGFYISGIYILFGTIIMVISKFFGMVPGQFSMLFLLIYLIYVSISFHLKITFVTILKHFFAAFLTVFFYVIFGFGFSYLMVS